MAIGFCMAAPCVGGRERPLKWQHPLIGANELTARGEPPCFGWF